MVISNLQEVIMLMQMQVIPDPVGDKKPVNERPVI